MGGVDCLSWIMTHFAALQGGITNVCSNQVALLPATNLSYPSLPVAPMASNAAPVAETERITAMDCLRGFAVLGILVMNIQDFAMPGAAYFNPLALGPPTTEDWAAWLLTHVFADHKFITLFSMLFGAGILLFTARAEKRGERVARLHYRRMFWLLLFGAAHAYLLWSGDILFSYAVCGMAVYPLRKCAPRTLLVVGVLLFSVSTGLALFFNWSMPHWPAAKVNSIEEEFWRPSPEKIAEEIHIYRSGWLAQMPDRAETSLFLETQYLLMNTFWYCSGLMLMGMALFKAGVITGARSRAFYLRMLLLGAPIGLALILYGAYRDALVGWNFRYSFFAGPEFNAWGSVALALAYVAAVMLACQAGRPAWLLCRLQAAGRMAFSNYIAQTLICTLIFYGDGLGLFGSITRAGQLLMAIGIWILQLWYSPLWLRRFRFGPLEWLWRSLTYGVRQPFLRAGAEGAG